MIVMSVVVMPMMILAIAVPVAPVSAVIGMIAVSVVPVAAVIGVFAVLLTVARHVFVVVPVVAHEVDRAAAGMVLRTMPAPVPFVPRRDVQVNRLNDNRLSRLYGNHRLCINDGRRRNVADVELPVEAGLANADGYGDVAGKRCRSREETQYCRAH